MINTQQREEASVCRRAQICSQGGDRKGRVYARETPYLGQNLGIRRKFVAAVHQSAK